MAKRRAKKLRIEALTADEFRAKIARETRQNTPAEHQKIEAKGQATLVKTMNWPVQVRT